MELNEKVQNWISLSDYDLDTADAMLETKRLLYVGFMCHQAVEKILKGYYEHNLKSIPPFIHDLERLATATGIWDKFSDEHKNLVHYIQPLNVQSRYTLYKDKIFASLTQEKCQRLIDQSRELVKWIKTLLLK